MAFCRTRSRSTPAPSSVMTMRTSPPAWSARSRTVPWAGLPAARRFSGVAMPWSRDVRRMWTSGSLSWSMTCLSTSVSPPSPTKTTSLPSSPARSRTSRRKVPYRPPMGTMRSPRVSSRSLAATRSSSSAMARAAGSWVPAVCSDSRDWMMASSPTRSTSRSRRVASTRMLAAPSPASLALGLAGAAARRDWRFATRLSHSAARAGASSKAEAARRVRNSSRSVARSGSADSFFTSTACSSSTKRKTSRRAFSSVSATRSTSHQQVAASGSRPSRSGTASAWTTAVPCPKAWSSWSRPRGSMPER